MRSMLVFLETQSWQKRFSDDSSDDHHEMLDLDDFAEDRAAVEYIISIMEAKGMYVASIRDEVEDVSYARKYLQIQWCRKGGGSRGWRPPCFWTEPEAVA